MNPYEEVHNPYCPKYGKPFDPQQCQCEYFNEKSAKSNGEANGK